MLCGGLLISDFSANYVEIISQPEEQDEPQGIPPPPPPPPPPPAVSVRLKRDDLKADR